MIKCLIVDDEPLAIQLLTSYVSKMDQLELLGSFSNPLDALSFTQTHPIDLIFLDIQMPELNGVQFAKVLGKKSKVIFTTAYPDYAVEGFELNAIDYLVKPITFQRFVESINRVIETNNTNVILSNPVNTEQKKDFLMVKTEHRLQKINFSDILYFKGMGDYVSIVTTTERIMTLENMKSFVEKLPDDNFIRVHKSYIISIDKIMFIERNRIGIKDELIPISATYQEAFWKVMGR